jgi:hypothetical protein
MSTKNLARTIIEGGRTGHAKETRKESIRFTRNRSREFISRCLEDPDYADGHVISKKRFYARSQKDKTTPVQRWLDAQAGRPWSDVYSEIRKRFDIRNVAQRHVVVDHMLGEIFDNGISQQNYFPRPRHVGMYVDEKGNLAGSILDRTRR